VDFGVAWGLYSVGGVLWDTANNLVTGHSYTLFNHRFLSFCLLAGWLLFYFCYQWAVSGKTLGMAILGIQVVTAEGRPIGKRQAALRTLGLGLTLLTLGIGFLGIVYQRERRALDDFVAGTAVVYDWDARAARLRWLARRKPAHKQA
jgi:uncharacterized RDD family membrane protein YckC